MEEKGIFKTQIITGISALVHGAGMMFLKDKSQDVIEQ